MSCWIETLPSIEKLRQAERLLLIVVCEEQTIRAELPARAAITFGRGPGCALRVDHRSVSRTHARVYGGRPVTVEDLESRNGTRIHGIPIRPTQRVPISPGDVVKCGEALLFLQWVPADDQQIEFGLDDSSAAFSEELVVGSDQCWFEMTPGARIELARRGPLRRVFLALFEQRRRNPGVALSVDAVASAGWPGERIHYASGVARVYTTINRLRVLGLGKVLLTHDDGYLLDPALPVRETRGPRHASRHSSQ